MQILNEYLLEAASSIETYKDMTEAKIATNMCKLLGISKSELDYIPDKNDPKNKKGVRFALGTKNLSSASSYEMFGTSAISKCIYFEFKPKIFSTLKFFNVQKVKGYITDEDFSRIHKLYPISLENRVFKIYSWNKWGKNFSDFVTKYFFAYDIAKKIYNEICSKAKQPINEINKIVKKYRKKIDSSSMEIWNDLEDDEEAMDIRITVRIKKRNDAYTNDWSAFILTYERPKYSGISTWSDTYKKSDYFNFIYPIPHLKCFAYDIDSVTGNGHYLDISGSDYKNIISDLKTLQPFMEKFDSEVYYKK